MAKQTPIPQGTATPGRKPAPPAHGRRGGRQARELRLDRSLDRHLRAFWRSESRAWREMVLAKLNDVPASGRFIDDVALHPRVGATAAEIRFSDSRRLIVGNVQPAAIVDLAQRVLRGRRHVDPCPLPRPVLRIELLWIRNGILPVGREGPRGVLMLHTARRHPVHRRLADRKVIRLTSTGSLRNNKLRRRLVP